MPTTTLSVGVSIGALGLGTYLYGSKKQNQNET